MVVPAGSPPPTRRDDDDSDDDDEHALLELKHDELQAKHSECEATIASLRKLNTALTFERATLRQQLKRAQHALAHEESSATAALAPSKQSNRVSLMWREPSL